jgi:hypothetical protein
MQLSLWHPMSCTHRVYGMTCEQWEGLRRRAGDLCEMCGKGDYHPLGVDHDHSLFTGFPAEMGIRTTGWVAVRGVICPKCNAHMRMIDAGMRPVDERTARYLANAWHLTNVPAETFPTPDPEPPFRSVVRAPHGRVYKRLKRGWVAIRQPRNRITEYGPRTWLYLSYRFGPENLHIVKH